MADAEGLESGGSFDRRRFLKRVAAVSAFAVPVVSTFSMNGINSLFSSASGQPYKNNDKGPEYVGTATNGTKGEPYYCNPNHGTNYPPGSGIIACASNTTMSG